MTSEVLLLALAGSNAVVVGVWAATLLVRQSPALRNYLWRIGLAAVWLVPLLAVVNLRLPERARPAQRPGSYQLSAERATSAGTEDAGGRLLQRTLQGRRGDHRRGPAH